MGRLDAMGVMWKAELDEREPRLFATGTDPDGNYVQIIQLHAGRGLAADGRAGPLAAAPGFSGFSVDDLAAAREFYAGVLGLDVAEANGLLTLHLAGGRDVLVYPKPDHVPATFTILNFRVPDIDVTVAELSTRGVRSARYPAVAQDDRGIQRDPDGRRSSGLPTPLATSSPCCSRTESSAPDVAAGPPYAALADRSPVRSAQAAMAAAIASG